MIWSIFLAAVDFKSMNNQELEIGTFSTSYSVIHLNTWPQSQITLGTIKIGVIGVYALLNISLVLRKDFFDRLQHQNSNISIAVVALITHIQIQMNFLLGILYLIGLYSLLPLLLIAQVQDNKWRSTLATFVVIQVYPLYLILSYIGMLQTDYSLLQDFNFLYLCIPVTLLHLIVFALVARSVQYLRDSCT